MLSAIANREDPFNTYHTVVRNNVNQEIASRLIEQLNRRLAHLPVPTP